MRAMTIELVQVRIVKNRATEADSPLGSLRSDPSLERDRDRDGAEIKAEEQLSSHSNSG